MTRRRSFSFRLGLGLAGVAVILAAISIFWTPHTLDAMPGPRLSGPSTDHWAGTDRLGRDLFTQLMIGARLAVQVGLGAVLIGAGLGIPIGLLAAVAARWLDESITSMLDIAIAFPTLLLAMVIVAVQGPSVWAATIAIGLGVAALVARLTRITARGVLIQDYIVAARTSGIGWWGILLRHVLPNIWPTIAVQLSLQFGLAIIAEASLSYLGLGAPPPNASWGRMLNEAQQTVLAAPTAAVFPGVLLVLTVIGINMVSDGLRDLLDPRLKEGAR